MNIRKIVIILLLCAVYSLNADEENHIKIKKKVLNVNKEVVLSESFDLGKVEENTVYFFAFPTCKSCLPLLDQLVSWGKVQTNQTKIIFYNLEESENKKNLYKISDQLNDYNLKLPLVLYNSQYYPGKESITNLMLNRGSDYTRSSENNGFSIFTVFTYGLIDGINPCAFTLVLLLISYLKLQLNLKKKILLSGILYVGSVFVTYFLIGLGLFEFIRKMEVYYFFSMLLKYGISAVLFLLGGISFYDFIKTRKGKTEKVVLKLPKKIQKITRSLIRTQTKKQNIFITSILLGILVSIFELGCTGQVYLPILGYIYRSTPSDFYTLFLLLLYNTAFIIPLLAVFTLVYNGVSSKKIGDLFSSNLPLIKILFFILFNLLAVLNLRI